MTFQAELMELPEPEAGTSVMDAEKRRMLVRRRPGRLLAALREISEEPIEVIARATDLPVNALLRFERGEEKPTVDALKLLARHNGIDVAGLLDAFGYA